ncbi:ribonuclease Z [Stutzerimonas stutzeri]|uniref:Ribonuclease Z n=1 Tax=Stutzerimonas stutzeri TaxID=316 RepID=A0A6I6LPE5_STUST|nr:ribonuclease Z [Stutzerimonas stutzeri]QGZ30226.1 MBL fold metallo-hydrolase [Stutzerimonas stutzeri]
MDLLFLGTSSGTPTRGRNVSALALLEDSGKGWYLIDCGEATQHQLLHTPLTLHGLRAVFITHVHGDHCYGLPGLLASAGMARRQAPLDIVAPAAIEPWVRATLDMSQSGLPYELRFHATETFTGWRNPYVRVAATALSHRVPSWGYTFTEARPDPRLDIDRLDQDGIPRGPLWGQLMRGHDVVHEGRTLRSEDYLLLARPPRRIVIGGDNDRPELLREACRDAHLLVHEATYTQAVADAGKNEFGHSSAAQVARFAQQAGVPSLVLTHFSARYQNTPGRGLSMDDLRREAAAGYKGNLFLARDFLKIHLSKDGIPMVENP